MAQYAGSAACRACHPAQFTSQSATGHARALSRAPAGAPGEWAFGAGEQAITYVSRLDGDWYIEHGFSYYSKTKSMALTPGHTDSKGVRLRTFDPAAAIMRCFECHSTGPLALGDGRSLVPAEPGVRCESCHGPGAAHIASKGSKSAIQNPKRLNAAAINELCGSCHRRPTAAGDDTDWSSAWNVRHQPLYLARSACFRKSAGALSCLTCHSPHAPLERAAARYDERCAGCHASPRHRTSVAGGSCAGCHMPRVDAWPELRFTNHWIGIYAKDSPLLPARRAQ
jgi:hypothetical protein